MDFYFLTVKAVRRTSDKKKQGACSSVVGAVTCVTPLSSESFHDFVDICTTGA